MTTTAYDTAAIHRQNVADLERELQRQRERADKAESAIASAREDLQSFIDSRNDWMARAEKAEAGLKELREQEPVAWCDPVEFADDPWSFQGFRIRTNNCPTMPLYTRPIPAPAPAVPEGDDFNGTTPHMIQCIESLVNMSDRGVLVPHGLCGHSRTLLLASANRLRQQPAPAVPVSVLTIFERLRDDLLAAHADAHDSMHRALLQSATQATAPAVPEEWRNIVTEMVGWWDDPHMTLTQGKAIREKARALLQSTQTSAGGVPSQTQEEAHD